MVPDGKEVGTSTVLSPRISNIKTRSAGTQTLVEDWCVASRVRARTIEEPQVVVESMTFENSAVRVEESEVVLSPQPATAVNEQVEPIASNSPTHSVHNVRHTPPQTIQQ